MYWLTGNLFVFLRLLGSFVEFPFPQVEFTDHVMLLMALAIVVALTVLPQNFVAFTEADVTGFIGSWMVPAVEFSSTLAKALKPTVRGVMLAFPGR